MMYGFNLTHKEKILKLHTSEDFAFNLAVSRALLTGDGAVVKRFFQDVAPSMVEDKYIRQEVNQSFFARGKPTNAFVFYGISKMIVDGIVRLVTAGGYTVEGNDSGQLKEMLDENNFSELWAKAEAYQSGLGDFAFKWSNDPDVSPLPILEIVSPEKIELIRKRQRIIGIDLKDRVKINSDEEYEFHEIHRMESGRAVIEYKILDCRADNTEVPFMSGQAESVKEIFGISDSKQVVYTDLTVLPVIYKRNTGGEDWLGDSGRGISNIHGFHTLEAALSEVLSNTVDEIRKAALKIFISDKLVRKNPDGTVIAFDDFDKNITITEGEALEGADKLIQAFTPEIHSEKFLQTVKELIANMCNKAGISPLTIGVTGLESIIASAESQQEREGKTSLRTRAAKLLDWGEDFKKVFNAGMQMYDLMRGVTPKDREYRVSFGDYSIPTKEEIVRTLTAGITAGLFSIREALKAYYSDTKTDEEIEQIYLEIKVEKGMALTTEEMLKVNGTTGGQEPQI